MIDEAQEAVVVQHIPTDHLQAFPPLTTPSMTQLLVAVINSLINLKIAPSLASFNKLTPGLDKDQGAANKLQIQEFKMAFLF